MQHLGFDLGSQGSPDGEQTCSRSDTDSPEGASR
jgi:hypothetical protein